MPDTDIVLEQLTEDFNETSFFQESSLEKSSDFDFNEKVKLNKTNKPKLSKKQKRLEKMDLLEKRMEMSSLIEVESKFMTQEGIPIYQNKIIIECLNDVDKILRELVLFSNVQEISLCPMTMGFRDIVKHLITYYKLGYSLKGNKQSKYLSIYRSKVCFIPTWDSKKVQNTQTHSTGIEFNSASLFKTILRFHRDWVKRYKRDEPLNFDEINFVTSVSCQKNYGLPKPGEVVGFNAPPLNESNIGFNMLKKMGWCPNSDPTSSLLETSSATPLQVVFRQSRAGIGFIPKS